MKFVANAFNLPAPLTNLFSLPNIWFKMGHSGSKKVTRSVDYRKYRIDICRIEQARVSVLTPQQKNALSFIGGPVLNNIDAPSITGTRSLTERKRRKSSTSSAPGAFHINTKKEPLYISALQTETEQLAKIGSWEYVVGAKSITCSKFIYQFLNIPQEKKIHQFYSLLPYLSVEYRALVQESWNELLSGITKEINHEIRLNDDQDCKWICLKAKAVMEGSRLVRIIGIIQDITEAKKHEALILAEKEKAEQDNKSKSEFVSVLSHEIRTPLNAIMGLTHLLLQEESIVANNKSNLESINFSAQNMLGLINSTLDFSRIEAGKIELEKINFNLKGLLRDIHRSLQPKALEKQLNFELAFDLNTPTEVAGDPTKLTQILNNLVCNAIKFTDQGKVKLSVDVVYQSNNDWVLEFAVTDTGMGIPEDRQQLIFESFTQANNAINRQYGGTGLGLSITKKLVDLHKGSIKVNSSPGQGSEFSVLLRFTKPQPSLATLKSNTNTDNPNTGLKGTKILVIDDNLFNQMVAKQLLTTWQAEVDTANDGAHALEKVKTAQYDLILMDLYMPIMSGFEAISQLRRTGYQMPIVALTANSSEEEKNKIIALGGNDYLTKPFIPQVLYNKLVQQINTKRLAS
ncbi:response regulator [Pontibacter sp. 13R65]|uniref:response regulator n=1 Tax=Pontibacter sp. 13R65 TaxID=3127458 RepID=UPI00301C1CFA